MLYHSLISDDYVPKRIDGKVKIPLHALPSETNCGLQSRYIMNACSNS